MSLDPWRELRTMREDINRAIGVRPGSLWSDDNSSVVTSVWTPAVDLKEEADKFVLHADLPGIDPTNIEVTMADGTLTIKGERKFEAESDRNGYKRVERAYGTFYRRFALPDTAAAEGIEAHSENGVLRVTIPKREAAKPRQISVRVR
jgi:HSP20 family protein